MTCGETKTITVTYPEYLMLMVALKRELESLDDSCVSCKEGINEIIRKLESSDHEEEKVE